MKNRYIKIISCILTGVILLFTLVFPVFSYEKPELTLTSEETSQDTFTVSLFLTNPNEAASIDFTLTTGNDYFCFDELIIKADGATDEVKYSDKTKFIYYFDLQATALSFSGFFTETPASDENIHLCDIIIKKTQADSENTTAELISYISSHGYSIPERVLFSLKNGEIIEENKINALPSGDVDADGKVTAADARQLLRASVKLEAISALAFPYGDTDFDGIISSSDARTALRISVGLDEAVMRSFSIRLKNGASCTDGGEYFYFCSLTNVFYSRSGSPIEHSFQEKDCTHNKECTYCGEVESFSTGHDFSDEGMCTVCNLNKSIIENIKNTVTPDLKNVLKYDIAASSAVDSKDYGSFIKNAILAEKQLKKCIDSLKGIAGAYDLTENLKMAYNIRFAAFLQCTNEDGNIPLNKKSFDVIYDAVNISSPYINYVCSVLQ